jgi:hypothetical protein
MFIASLQMLSCNPTCEQTGEHDKYILKNQSDKTIQIWIIENYPDTIIPSGYKLSFYSRDILSPNSTREDIIKLRRGSCIEDNYTNGIKKWLYIFDNDSLKSLPWDTVRLTGRGVLERIAIDLDYLKAHNFTLTYEE